MFEALSQETCYTYRGSSDLVKGSFVPHRKQEITVRKKNKADGFVWCAKKKSTGYAGGGGGQRKGFSSSKRQYTKKLRCAKLNVRLATVHKKSTQEDVLMKNQENDTFSLAQDKYPWGFIKIDK